MQKYIRVATLSIEEVLPFVFTKHVRAELRKSGFSYTSEEWINKCKKEFSVVVGNKKFSVVIPMGSHRYQLFAEKGTTCIKCGVEGKYFAVERGVFSSTEKYHLNLYGIGKNGIEIMLTKDHILPRSRGGKNMIDNYQTLCFECNNRKSNG